MGLCCKITIPSSVNKSLEFAQPMAGFVNFKYRDGIIPTHTKSSFNCMKVLTVQDFIAKNALLFYAQDKILSKFTSQISEKDNI